MKIKYKSILFFAAIVVFLNVSCEDDLNVLPQDSDLLLEDDFFGNDESYRQLLAGVYANLSLSGLNGAGSSNITWSMELTELVYG